MRRELKFRAWDRNGKKMILNSSRKQLRFDYCGDWYFETGEDETLTSSFNSYLMQYTGLKDAANKNEVYEHDIINLLGIGFLKVEWDYRDTGWICIDKHYKKRNLVHVLLNGGIRVGNIYENPELLKEKE